MLDQQKKELVAVTSESIGKKEPVLQSASFFPDRNDRLEKAINNENDDYWSLFLYAMKSPVLREKNTNKDWTTELKKYRLNRMKIAFRP